MSDGVVLINPFRVKRDLHACYLDRYRAVMRDLSQEPGFRGGALHAALDPDTAPFQFINVNRWESAEAFRKAIAVVKPSDVFGDLTEQIEASPGLYRVEQSYPPADAAAPGRLADKAVLVTGASSGIGRAVAERLAGDGASVVVHYGGGREAAAAVAAGIAGRGGRAVLASADLADPEAVRDLVDEAQAAFGGLDMLVLNAGAPLLVKPIAETSDAEYDGLFAVNARATFLLLRHAAGVLRDGGRVVGLSTPYVAHPEPDRAAVAASKAALQALVLAAAKEWGGRGITANCVIPGATDTGGFRAGVPERAIAAIEAQTPMGRLGRPEDIADVVAFLCSDDARWVTGQVLAVNGGLF